MPALSLPESLTISNTPELPRITGLANPILTSIFEDIGDEGIVELDMTIFDGLLGPTPDLNTVGDGGSESSKSCRLVPSEALLVISST